MCETYLYTADKGLRFDVTGEPYKRVPGAATPCGSCPKVPQHIKEYHDDWRILRSHAQDMSEANQKAYAFYLKCKATNRFPDDPVVDWYSGLIRQVEETHARDQSERSYLELGIITALMKARHGQ